ncbi:E3 ubiquitin-protein ligase RNF13 [Fistulifera solaris]|uniref:RING-type E3 ubiquitin transferase n=1 Tax=Fistulifera solaris TaxID=1519565 RepID=A0A1Z5JNR1_FISSO|nr:E3 ubiquitin-protein ligase RNF13 [Fistulifera solaris]|eukprot:GAX15634.1 E3 ubiquitin-protein ligase RNF13 [Fistulifera solaris]
MLDNPNSNLRRHNSLPSSRARPTLMKVTYRKCSNLSLKSNPYVGWFRHSPPLTSHHHSSSSQHSAFTAHSYPQGTQNKSSPYVGWFRHAPPTCCKLDVTLLQKAPSHFAEYLQQELPAILRSIPSHSGLYRLEDLLCSGHLYGGSPQLFLKNKESSSFSGSLFNVLACWLFQDDDIVLHHSKIWEATLEGNNNKKGQELSTIEASASQDDSASCSSSSSSSSIPSMAVSVDEFDACSVQLQRHSSSLSYSSAMLSSQAEAYYVHNALAGSRSSGPSDTSGFGRLDYDISQMDIVRMARSASRHLDVESILRLPTITYQSRLTATRIPEETSSDEEDDHSDSTGKPEEWSWMLVQEGGYGSKEVQHKDKRHRSRSNQKGLPDYAEDDDVCVICLEQFADGDRLRVLPCSHSFHVGCIDQWLSGSHSFDDCFTTGCPTCKKDACPDGDDSSESMVPSWAFARIGDALARQDSSHRVAL